MNQYYQTEHVDLHCKNYPPGYTVFIHTTLMVAMIYGMDIVGD